MKKLVTLGAALVFCLGNVALAADNLTGTLKKIKEAGVITIGNRESSLPFSYLNQSNQPVGYTVDLCNAVVERIKQEIGAPNLIVKYMTVASAARIPLLSNGTIDMECSTTSISLSRMRQVGFSSPIFAVGTRILATKTSGVKDWDDLRQKAIGVAQGTNSERIVRELSETPAFKGTKVLVMRDQGAGLLALETGRVDGYVTDDIVLFGLRSTSRIKDQLVITGRPLTFDTFAIMIRRDDPDFRLMVDSALAGVYRGPDIARLYTKWFGPLEVPMSEANTYVYKVGAITP
jgi:glutamate/aspartate transport system substrate-binding protein